MTNKDVILKILAEASGRTVKDIEHLAAQLPMLGNTGSMGKELSDKASEELLIKLRGQMPGIKRWLHEGGLIESLDRATTKSPTQ